VGGVSDPIETPYGYHLIRLEERRVIPLAEVRDQVLSRLVDLRIAAPKAEAWAARHTELLRLEESAILRRRIEEGADDLYLASWPGGGYRGAELRRYLMTLDREAADRLAATEADAFLEVVRALARNALLAQRAGEMGISLSDEEEAGLTGPAQTRFVELAGALNFRRAMPPELIKAAALKALAPGGQRALVARGEVLSMAEAIRHRLPVRSSGSD
jgi:hypothetical protein